MKRLALIFVLPVLLVAQSFPKQGRGARPWFLNRAVVKELNLTDAQTRQMDQIQQDFRQPMFNLRAEVNKAEADFDAAFNDDPVDQGKANDAITRLVAARGELTKAVSQMSLKMRVVLTAEQWQQLKQRPRGGWPNGRGPHRRPTIPTNSK